MDVICVDDNDVVLDHGKVKSNFHNAHDTIRVTIKPFMTTSALESFSYRKYRDITFLILTRFLETCDWTALLSSGSEFGLELGLSCLSNNSRVGTTQVGYSEEKEKA